MLRTVGTFALPQPLVIDLYEQVRPSFFFVLLRMSTQHARSEGDVYRVRQIVIEMIELKESETARAMLRDTAPMVLLRNKDPERYLRLQRLINKPFFDHRDAYPDGSNREKRRAVIAKGESADLLAVCKRMC